MSITAATKWPTNAEMIVDIVELGYIRPNDSVIDLTFGGGKWWTLYAHAGLFVANVDPGDDTLQISRRLNGLEVLGIERDFRDLGDMGSIGPHGGLFDVVVFDPPYVSMGGRATSTMPEFMGRYGLENAATTPELLQADNERGSLRRTGSANRAGWCSPSAPRTSRRVSAKRATGGRVTQPWQWGSRSTTC